MVSVAHRRRWGRAARLCRPCGRGFDGACMRLTEFANSGYTDDGSQNDNRPDGAGSSQNTGYGDTLRHRYWHFVDTPFTRDGPRSGGVAHQRPKPLEHVARLRPICRRGRTVVPVR